MNQYEEPDPEEMLQQAQSIHQQLDEIKNTVHRSAVQLEVNATLASEYDDVEGDAEALLRAADELWGIYYRLQRGDKWKLRQ